MLLVFLFLLNCPALIADGSIDKGEMLDRLRFADIETRMRDKTYITPKQSKMLTGKPVSIFSMYIDLKHTRNIRVTAIEFENEMRAVLMDKKSVSGFRAKNWFFIGMVDTKSTQEIIKAIEQ
ncbi:MAG: hypothetical protein L3J52_05845 [Proteobacteria bacterium]|nr:hypothetical protein [Pseudomonadota bacterium]